MKSHALKLLLIIFLTGTAAGQVAPTADHHQHVFSPVIVKLISGGSGGPSELTAKDVVTNLDAASIQRGLLLSVAYMYGRPSWTIEDEYAKVRAENDWTAAQAAQYPKRLLAFCGFNPLKEYALLN